MCIISKCIVGMHIPTCTDLLWSGYIAEKRKGSSSDSSPNLSSIRRTRKDDEKDDKGSQREKREKRRSKSVGAFARIGTKPKILGPKPKGI